VKCAKRDEEIGSKCGSSVHSVIEILQHRTAMNDRDQTNNTNKHNMRNKENKDRSKNTTKLKNTPKRPMSQSSARPEMKKSDQTKSGKGQIAPKKPE